MYDAVEATHRKYIGKIHSIKLNFLKKGAVHYVIQKKKYII